MSRTTTAKNPRRLLTDFIPPEGVPIHFKVASLGARFAAQLADILITVSTVLIILLLISFGDLMSGASLEALAALLFFALRVPYYVTTEILWNGQTIGKRLLGIRAISADGRTLTAHAVTVRNLMKEMEVFVPGTYLLVTPFLDPLTVIIVSLWIVLLLTVPLLSRRSQRMGDVIANTLVVEMPRPALLPDITERRDTSAQAKFVFLPHHLDHYGRYELQTLENLLQIEPAKLSPAAQRQHADGVTRVAGAIIAKIGFNQTVAPQELRRFLAQFYTAQRAYLENRRLMGDKREDKFYSETP